MPARRFPDGFVWGTATAAHQVEGGNWNNDWWAWEHTPGSPCREPSGDACDHYHRYAGRHRAARRPRLRRLSLLARVEPHRARGGRVLARRARPLPAHVRGVPRARPRARSSPSTTSRRRAGWRRAAAGPSRRPPTASPRFCERAAAHLGDVDRPGLHDQRAEHRRRHVGYRWGIFPPGRARCRPPPPRQRRASSPRTARPSTPSSAAAARRPGRPHARDAGLPGRRTAARRARRASAATWRTSSSRRRAATTSSACRPTRASASGPTGMRGPRARRAALDADGLRVLARGARGDDPPRLGGHAARARSSSPRTASAPTDDARAHRLRRARRSRGVLALPRRRHRRPRLRLLEPARQLRVGVRLRPDVRPRRRRPDDAGAHARSRARAGSARSRGRTRCRRGEGRGVRELAAVACPAPRRRDGKCLSRESGEE